MDIIVQIFNILAAIAALAAVSLLIVIGTMIYAQIVDPSLEEKQDKFKGYLWRDRNRWFLGLPTSFTVYYMDKERLFIQRGLFNTVEDETRLYRVMDLKLKVSFWQKLFRVGTVAICSSDKALGNFELKNIKNPREVKELLSDLVEQQRDAKRVVGRELMSGSELSEEDDDNEEM